MKRIFSWRVAVWAGACLLAVLFAITYRQSYLFEKDPDRFFHFALSRQMVESGKLFLRELPQADGLGWGQFFVEKEFLFHQLTAAAYRLGGETGVALGLWAVALGGLLAFFFYARQRVGVGLAFLSTAVFWGTPIFLFRLHLLRPHVVAITFFVLILIGILRQRALPAALAIFFFCLAYHAFYIPLLMVLLWLAAELITAGRLNTPSKTTVALLLGGLVLGVVVNPYFPANLISGMQISLIPSLMAGKLSSVAFGSELYPLQSDFLLVSLLVPLITVGGAVWRAGRDWQKGELDLRLLYLLLCAGAFLWMTFQSRRGVEYLLPVCAFLFVELAERIERESGRHKSLLVALCVVAFAWHGWVFAREKGKFPPEEPWLYLDAMAAIPPESGKKVFNCEWDLTPYLYYARPDLKFIDILDPSLLFFHNRAAHEAREKVKLGEVADIHGMLKNAFKADYVLCRDIFVLAQLEKDPRFRRLYPRNLKRGSDIVPQVFEIQESPAIPYVKEYEVAFVPASLENFQDKAPSDAGSLAKHSLTRSGFLNLAAVFGGQADSPALCALVRPSKEAMKRLNRATYLALGGGRNLRLWRNGKPLYDSEAAFSRALQHQLLLPLATPLSENDSLEFIVCSAAGANYWGLSVAGFTERELEDTCRWKRELDLSPQSKFPFGRERSSCMGPVALPLLDDSVR